jgi:hypothetical protein
VTKIKDNEKMAPFIGKLLKLFFPWIRRTLFGTAVKSAGKGALKKTPLNFGAPNLLVSALAVCVVNAVKFAVMSIWRDSASPALVSAGIVTIVTALFAIQGARGKNIVRECIALFAMLAVFFGIFVFFIFIVDWWFLAFVAKLTLELLLCYAIMLSRKEKADAAQSKLVAGISKLLKITPDGRLAKLLSHLDPF